jgi:hypothetical protein
MAPDPRDGGLPESITRKEAMQRMNTKMRCWMLGGSVASLAAGGCVDPRVIVPGDDSTGASTGSNTSGSPGTSTATTDPADDTRGTTGNSITSGETTAGDDTGVAFVGPELDMGGSLECDLLAQDCPEGQKCMPWANDGGDYWNAWGCKPLAEDPAAVGEPCHVEGSSTTGIDDCELGAMCWDVDPRTNQGECIGFCVGSSDGIEGDDVYCDDPDEICRNGGIFFVCIPRCNPLEQDCLEGLTCLPINDEWECVVDASGDQGAYGDSCEFINVCDPGLVCLDVSTVAGCEAPIGCCTDVCDTTDPLGDMQCAGVADGAICQPWYDVGDAPLGLDDVGVCLLPQ